MQRETQIQLLFTSNLLLDFPACWQRNLTQNRIYKRKEKSDFIPAFVKVSLNVQVNFAVEAQL